MNGIPIDIAVQVNEIADQVERATGLPVLQVQQLTDVPPKASLSFLTAKGVADDRVQILIAFMVAGVECLVWASPYDDSPRHSWDMMIVTREHGLQMWPNNPRDAVSVPHDDDLKEAANIILREFLQRLASKGEEKFLEWIRKCLTIRAQDHGEGEG